MSFSKQFLGTAVVIIAAAAAFQGEQRAIDESNGASEGVVNGHARQIEAGTNAIKAVLETLPQDVEMSVSLWGHAGDDERGSYGFQVNGLPTPPKQE